MKKRLSRESYPEAARRAARLSTSELYNVSEVSLYAVGAAISGWRRGGGTEALDEADRNILVLLEVCRELRARETS